MSELKADRGMCIGAGMCVMTDSAVFDQDDDGIVVLLEEDPETDGKVRAAVDACPSGALSITGD
ncbi:(4Fe-4S)-binding protein [Pseudonocardia sp. NPDC049154]|uniref:ferredoxin n=1 Tax=Pseudonocardia sp. NPDC049154 TaxID=3155501 RepID=UPI0033C5A05B